MNKINYEIVNFCEIDKSAAKSYCSIYNVAPELNLGNISEVNETKLSKFNLMTWGFPCQNISKAGNMLGFRDKNGNQTKSGLYDEAIRILRHCRPEISIIENVEMLLSQKFKSEFNQIIEDLSNAGYNNYYDILCAKDYEIPQNRKRVFIVSIRKDIDNGKFKLPLPIELNKFIDSFLEDKVDDKYYLSQESISNNFLLNNGSKIKGYVNPDYIPVSQATKLGYIDCKIGGIMDLSYPTSKTRRGRVQGEYGNICPTLTASKQSLVLIESKTRIRYLTTLERFRLMGFNDKDYYKALNNGVTEQQLYKQSGNSIVTTIPYYIFKNLYNSFPALFSDIKVLSLFSGIGAFEHGLKRLYSEINNPLDKTI